MKVGFLNERKSVSSLKLGFMLILRLPKQLQKTKTQHRVLERVLDVVLLLHIGVSQLKRIADLREQTVVAKIADFLSKLKPGSGIANAEISPS